MKYIVRINPKAYNPLTRKVIAERLWEIEQCATRDSEAVKWHCADVRIDSTPIRELFTIPAEGTWEHTAFGICVRGMDDVVEIKTRPQEVSGN